MLEISADEAGVFSIFPLPCSSDSMQSADDDTTAPPCPTEFNLQVRQLKLTKTGDAESFTVGAAAAIAAEKRRSPPNDTGKTIADMQKVEREWSIILSVQHGPHELASLYAKRHSGWSAMPCKPRLCCISDHLPFLRPGCKGPPGKPYPPLSPHGWIPFLPSKVLTQDLT
ncbi:hypothetical protein ALUC_20241S [Aspergillus luchuensis]|nr:hypothetical protein ALUC_20241S [Aspergillus luchuensis]